MRALKHAGRCVWVGHGGVVLGSYLVPDPFLSVSSLLSDSWMSSGEADLLHHVVSALEPS